MLLILRCLIVLSLLASAASTIHGQRALWITMASWVAPWVKVWYTAFYLGLHRNQLEGHNHAAIKNGCRPE
ncbi:MAG: hypothetical protein NT138_08570 [Planctomycetales bacterium]|nr:hypothetical protein [Planctomycetales bacterium]